MDLDAQVVAGIEQVAVEVARALAALGTATHGAEDIAGVGDLRRVLVLFAFSFGLILGFGRASMGRSASFCNGPRRSQCKCVGEALITHSVFLPRSLSVLVRFPSPPNTDPGKRTVAGIRRSGGGPVSRDTRKAPSRSRMLARWLLEASNVKDAHRSEGTGLPAWLPPPWSLSCIGIRTGGTPPGETSDEIVLRFRFGRFGSSGNGTAFSASTLLFLLCDPEAGIGSRIS